MEGLSLGVGIATLIAIIGATWRLGSRLTKVETRVDAIDQKLTRLNGIGDRFQSLEATCRERHRATTANP